MVINRLSWVGLDQLSAVNRPPTSRTGSPKWRPPPGAVVVAEQGNHFTGGHTSEVTWVHGARIAEAEAGEP